MPDGGSIFVPGAPSYGVPAKSILGNLTPGVGPAQPISLSDLAQAVAATGAIASPNAPVVLPNSGVTAGSYTLASITVNAQGLVTAASNGSASGGGLWSGSLSTKPTSANTGLTNWLNQGGASVADSANGISITAPTSTGDNLRVRYKAAPGSTPYSFKALVGLTCNPANFSLAGIGWHDGTKLQVIDLVYSTGWKIEVTSWTNVTTFSTGNFASTAIMGNPIWLRIRDDGTNVTWGWSISGDDNDFITLFSVAKASGFLGASGYSNVLFFCDRNGTSPASSAIATLLSWAQGS